MVTDVLSRVKRWISNSLRQTREADLFEKQVSVSFNELGISSRYPDGTVQSISWHDVQCIAIETNDGGPWGADVWWLIEGNQSRCTYPNGATGEHEVAKELKSRFPGLVVQGMNSTSNRRFVCWQRK